MLFYLLRLKCISVLKLGTPIPTHRRLCRKRWNLKYCISLFAKKQKFPGTSTWENNYKWKPWETARAVDSCLPHFSSTGAAGIELPLEKPVWACAVRLGLSEEKNRNWTHSSLKEIHRPLVKWLLQSGTCCSLLNLLEPSYKNTGWEICQVRLKEKKETKKKATMKCFKFYL